MKKSYNQRARHVNDDSNNENDIVNLFIHKCVQNNNFSICKSECANVKTIWIFIFVYFKLFHFENILHQNDWIESRLQCIAKMHTRCA